MEYTYPTLENTRTICTACGTELPIASILGEDGHATIGVKPWHECVTLIASSWANTKEMNRWRNNQAKG